MNIQSLLNSTDGASRECPSVGSSLPPSAQHYLVPDAVPKRQKMAKDAPVFSESTKIVGHVNYPPHEAGSDRDLEARHREFYVFPLGQIHRKGVRHIPYNSDKKDFLEKTGREAFEVFQYTYKRPGEDREYVVVWDYNVGLVRMTPFFKSCKYSKTVPAKALRENPGMKDISYSITGGALVCQGYWMPYQAAREIAATFCWDIRWALTPVFGNEFPQICRPPQHPSFAKFVIDPQTVSFCAAETTRFKKDGPSYQLLKPKTASPILTSLMPTLSSPMWKPSNRPGDLESGYGTDTERNEKTALSPQVSPRSQCGTGRFTSINRTESLLSPHTTYSSAWSSPAYSHVPTSPLLQTVIPGGDYSESHPTKRTHSTAAHRDGTKVANESDILQMQKEHAADGQRLPGLTFPVDRRDIEAAEILLSLSVVARDAAALPESKRTRRGSRH